LKQFIKSFRSIFLLCVLYLPATIYFWSS